MMVELTDAEILCLHKWMWSDMKRELGDNPRPTDRTYYKRIWCTEHKLNIPHNCFLCLNAERYDPKLGVKQECDQCLVKWPAEKCYSDYFFLFKRIGDILNLPTREFVSDRRTIIFMRECDAEELKRRMEEGE